jgi:hypothetical protein
MYFDSATVVPILLCCQFVCAVKNVTMKLTNINWHHAQFLLFAPLIHIRHCLCSMLLPSGVVGFAPMIAVCPLIVYIELLRGVMFLYRQFRGNGS